MQYIMYLIFCLTAIFIFIYIILWQGLYGVTLLDPVNYSDFGKTYPAIDILWLDDDDEQ